MAEPEASPAPVLTVVTSEMVEAGVYAAREHPLGASLGDLMTQVYLAMRAEELG